MIVQPNKLAALSPAPAGGPMTPVKEEKDATFTRPIGDPGGETRMEVWRATSVDEMWYYERLEGDGSLWLVCYNPTGQTRDGYTTLGEARQHTAGRLLHELRTEAYTAAFLSTDPVEQQTGHRWIAIHMRIAAKQANGQVDVMATCGCGGWLTICAEKPRRLWAHVDACNQCRPDGGDVVTADPCPNADFHLHCGRPDAELTDREHDILDFELLWWKQPGSKLVAIRERFGLTEVRYYQLVNALLDNPAALAHAPALVKRLRRIRERRVAELNRRAPGEAG
jgi:hypothetical protein